VRSSALALLLPGLLAACGAGETAAGGDGEGAGGDGAAVAGVLEVVARPLSEATGLVYFTFAGYGLEAQAIGGPGTLAPNGGAATLALTHLPLGYKTVRAWGLAHTEDDGDGWYRLTDSGTAEAQLAERSDSTLEVPMAPDGSPALGVERFLLNADHAFVAHEPAAGSPDGSNSGRVLVTGVSPGDPVRVTAEPVEGTAGAVGLFTALPQGGVEAWPDPDSWVTELTVTADDSGQAALHVVARPTQTGRDVVLRATATGLDARGFVRVAGAARLEGGSD